MVWTDHAYMTDAGIVEKRCFLSVGGLVDMKKHKDGGKGEVGVNLFAELDGETRDVCVLVWVVLGHPCLMSLIFATGRLLNWNLPQKSVVVRSVSGMMRKEDFLEK